MDVVAMGLVVERTFDAAEREALFPDGHFGFEAEGEASFDVLHGLLNGDVGRGCDEEVEVVGHEGEGVELVATFGAVVVEELEEKVGVVVDLKEAAAIGGDGGDEEGADFLRSSLHRSKLEREAAGGKMTFVRRDWVEGFRFGRGGPTAKAASFWGLLFHSLKAVASTVASLCETLCAVGQIGGDRAACGVGPLVNHRGEKMGSIGRRPVEDAQDLVDQLCVVAFEFGFDVVHDGHAAASMVSSGPGHVLCKFTIAVDDYKTAIRQLQCECGAVDLEGLPDSNVIIDSGVVVRIFLVLAINYLHV
jgi:hypothetical protein